MEVSLETLLSPASAVLWTLLKVAGFLMVVPVFGNQLVSPRIRIALALAISIALGPLAAELAQRQGLTIPSIAEFDISYVPMIIVQVLTGVGLGFAAMIFFHIFVVVGQFIGMQMGLGFAAMVDPGNGVQVTVWSQFFLMLVTLSFLAIDGHLVLLEVLLTGQTVLPDAASIAASGVLSAMAMQIVQLGGWMFVGGVLLALPAAVALLIVNTSFGVMNRSAPQLNVFSLGFPFGLIFGLLVIWFLLRSWIDFFSEMASEFFQVAMQLIAG